VSDLPAVIREATPADLNGLATVLRECVEGGAAIGFRAPLSTERATTFWQVALDAAGRGDRVVLVAEDAAGVVGTVSVVLNLPDNQPHRADVAKLMVHPRGRRLGIGSQLLATAEAAARTAGRTVLVLDTATGSDAERMYARHGWQRVGDIPAYALWPDGRPCSTTYYFKHLGPVSGSG
jgi:GNAT superfamily N-acetyltransferase